MDSGMFFHVGGSPYSPDLFSPPLYKLETKGSTKHGRFMWKGNSSFILDKLTTNVFF
jgi:hypothetical protein